MLLDFHSEIFSWIRGGLFALFLYHFLIYFQNRSKLYLYYSLYLLALTIYLLNDVSMEVADGFFNYFNFSIQFLAYAAYVSFARDLLETRMHLVTWDRYFSIEVKVLFALSAIFPFIQLTLGYEFQEKAFTVFAPLLTIFTLVSYYVIITRIKDKFSVFFVVGSLIYVLLANVSFIEMISGPEMFINNGVQPMFFVYLGAFLQCLIFSIIIGFIIKRFEDKSKNAEIRLAIKLKEMEELKMTALQSQMNPHFLFNSLNSINNFIIKSDVERASDYITKFSKLIRAILNSSSSPTSSLSEELEILGLYVKMEQMRVSGGFDFHVTLDENLQLDKIKVPPLFLQPFIENSIWHGIMKKEGEKRIDLSIKGVANVIECVIEDNGVGIKNNETKTHIDERRKFFGAKATEDRIRMLYKNKDVNISTDNISSGAKTGTRVTISFPMEYQS